MGVVSPASLRARNTMTTPLQPLARLPSPALPAVRTALPVHSWARGHCAGASVPPGPSLQMPRDSGDTPMPEEEHLGVQTVEWGAALLAHRPCGPHFPLSHDGDPCSHPAPGLGQRHPPLRCSWLLLLLDQRRVLTLRPSMPPTPAPPPLATSGLHSAQRPSLAEALAADTAGRSLPVPPCPARPAGRCVWASVHEPGPQGLSSCVTVTLRRGFTFPCLQPALALYPRLWLLSRAGFPPSSSPTMLGPAPCLAFKVQSM